MHRGRASYAVIQDFVFSGIDKCATCGTGRSCGSLHSAEIAGAALKEGQLEVQGRREDKASTVALPDIVADVRARLAA